MEGTLTALLTLSNNGTQTTFCRHPASLLNAADGHLEMEAWPDQPAVGAADVFTFDVAKAEMLRSTRGAGGRDQVLEIPSSGTIAFLLEAPFPKKSPGPYRLRVGYVTMTQEFQGQQLVYGKLHSQMVTVTTK